MKKTIKLLSLLISITLIIQIFNSPLISNATEEKLVDNIQSSSVISDEMYSKNAGNSIEIARLLRKDKEFKKYDVYLDDNGILNVMVFDDENENIKYGEEIKSELFAKHKNIQNVLSTANLDSAKVIYRKVKFSKEYLLKIQDFVTKHAKDYGIISVGSGSMINQVEIELLDIEKSKDFLDLLEQNITDFSEDAVKFTESAPYEGYN